MNNQWTDCSRTDNDSVPIGQYVTYRADSKSAVTTMFIKTIDSLPIEGEWCSGTTAPPVKVIDGDDGSERDCPDLVPNGSPDYEQLPTDDQMWSPRNGSVYPIVRTMPVGVRPGVSIEFSDGVCRLFEDPELDSLRDQLVELRGLPRAVKNGLAAESIAVDKRMRADSLYHERQLDELMALKSKPRAVIRRMADFVGVSINQHTNDDAETLETILKTLTHHGLRVARLVWTAEPPECDCWWLRVGTIIPCALSWGGSVYAGSGFAYGAGTLSDYGTQGDRFAAIPGGIPRGPKS